MNSSRIALHLAACLALLPAVASFAAPGLNKAHDWTIELETKKMPLHFQYTGTNLRPCIKAELKYFEVGEEENKTLYEYLWYANDKTIGLDRRNKLNIKPGDAIAIVVKHAGDDASYEERRAAAKAIMSAVLDAQVNHNMVATIKVPSDSFSTICSEIQHYHFYPESAMPDEEVNADLCLFVESESGQKETLYHHN